MAILRIVCGPADVDDNGYTWNVNPLESDFDAERVAGAFNTGGDDVLKVAHPESGTTSTWYHFRHAQKVATGGTFLTSLLEIADVNSAIVASIAYSQSRLRISAVGDTTAQSGTIQLAAKTAYSLDVHVIVSTTVTVRLYVNSALVAELTVDNTVGGRTNPRVITWFSDLSQDTYTSEIMIADEDTRGMRVREMRPKSFGIFQEWDGSISSLRDTDLATGISTSVANRRVSFGVSNIEYVQPGDVINRVIAQTFAQKGEVGLSAFNHFFRDKNGTVSDGVDHTLNQLGEFFVEEFPLNPATGVAWQPADFSSLQTGVQSKT